MNRTFIKILLMVVALMTAVACANVQPEPTSEPEADTASVPAGRIVIADISDDPIDKIEEFQPMADYLASHLHEQGIGLGEVKVAPDLETMGSWLASGEVDLYFDSAFPAIVVGETAGAYPILRRWKDGVAQYNTVIVTLADGGLNSLDELPGHAFGFEDPQSTSGYFMPLTYLLDNGMNPVEMESDTATPAADEVGYVFTGDGNTIEWVRSGRVDAAAIQSTDFDELPEEIKAELRVLAETQPMPRHLVIVRPGLDPALEAAIYDVLVAMDETAEGTEVLLLFEETAQFDALPATATEFLDKIRTLYLQLQEG